MTNIDNGEILQIIVWDVATGQQTIRDFSEQEIADLEETRLQIKNQEKASQEKAEFRKSALAKLAKLGLTQQEIESL
jgi:hypothetical protein